MTGIIREVFIEKVDPVLQKFKDALKEMYNKCGRRDISKISHVVMTGGSMNIPAAKALVREIFPDKQYCMIDTPESILAYGNAYKAAKFRHKSLNVITIEESIKRRNNGIQKGTSEVEAKIGQNLAAFMSPDFFARQSSQPEGAAAAEEEEKKEEKSRDELVEQAESLMRY